MYFVLNEKKINFSFFCALSLSLSLFCFVLLQNKSQIFHFALQETLSGEKKMRKSYIGNGFDRNVILLQIQLVVSFLFESVTHRPRDTRRKQLNFLYLLSLIQFIRQSKESTNESILREEKRTTTKSQSYQSKSVVRFVCVCVCRSAF